MKRIIIESPYAGETPADVEANEAYLRRCLRFCLLQGHAPFASHGLYTLPGVLDDRVPVERRAEIEAGFAWRPVADETWVFLDRGCSSGMREGVVEAMELIGLRRPSFIWLDGGPKPLVLSWWDGSRPLDGAGSWLTTYRSIRDEYPVERPTCTNCRFAIQCRGSEMCVDCMHNDSPVHGGLEDGWRFLS